MKLSNIHRWPTERLSQRILYVLIGMATVIFSLFYVIGYDHPYAINPNFNAPLFTDAIIWLMFVLVLGAVGLTFWAVWTGLRKRGKSGRLDNNIPVKQISYAISIGTVVLAAVTFGLGSSSEMLINSRKYADTLWLKTADMFIYTGGLLLIAAVAAVVYGATRYYRKEKR